MSVWIVSGVGGIIALCVVAVVAFFLLAGRYDLAPIAARYASVAAGRHVSIGSLHVTPGEWIAIDLRAARLDNVAGGTAPAMVEVGSLTAQVQAMSLLRGPVVVRDVAIDGASVLLERPQGKTANWKFGPQPAAIVKAPAPALPESRAGFPTLLQARLAGVLVFRTSSGAALRMRVNSALLKTSGPDQPVRLVLDGSYNDVPITLQADLAPIAVLRDASTPYSADVHAVSGDTTVHFVGTMTDPLNADGMAGTLDVFAANPKAILQIAGVTSDANTSLRLTGHLVRRDPLWEITNASGAVNDAKFTAPLLRLDEGARGKPDRVAVDIAFPQLDLNTLLAARLAKGATASAEKTDIPLSVSSAPDTLIEANLALGRVVYNKMQISNVRFDGGLTPGKVAVRNVSLNYLGAQIKASGTIIAAQTDTRQDSGNLAADVAITQVDVQTLRQLIGVAKLPLLGQMEGRAAIVATGDTLNHAARGAHVSAVIAMNSGSISRRLIELASLDARTLFRRADGMSNLACLVGVVDMRAGVGTITPLRIRAEAGTISGNGTFDLYRQQVDLVAGTESKTTNFFALDVPVRVSGSFTDPKIRPAKWSGAGRAKLAAADDVSQLLPSLQPFARRSPCVAVGGDGGTRK